MPAACRSRTESPWGSVKSQNLSYENGAVRLHCHTFGQISRPRASASCQRGGDDRAPYAAESSQLDVVMPGVVPPLLHAEDADGQSEDCHGAKKDGHADPNDRRIAQRTDILQLLFLQRPASFDVWHCEKKKPSIVEVAFVNLKR